MGDLLSLLIGIALLALGALGIRLILRAATRVDRADAAEQQEGGIYLFTPYARWFGVALLGVPTLVALIVGTSLILGSLGVVEPFTPPGATALASTPRC